MISLINPYFYYRKCNKTHLDHGSIGTGAQTLYFSKSEQSIRSGLTLLLVVIVVVVLVVIVKTKYK